MRNLRIYDGNTFDFHKSVISQKKITKADPTYKDRILTLDQDIHNQFLFYDDHYVANSLQELECFGFDGHDKEDLLALYSYRNKVLQELKTRVTTTDTNRIINSCQNCTINEINSFDHLLPKEDYAEYVVNPKNLFPSCTMCNGYKAKAWRESGRRLFLNLYRDYLPKERYLFVDIDVSVDKIETNFYLDNPYKIDGYLFELIKSHYSRLHLCKRFTDNNDSVITSLKNDISAFDGELNQQQVKSVVVNRCKKNMESFGYNYWKSILEISLIENENFLNSIVN